MKTFRLFVVVAVLGIVLTGCAPAPVSQTGAPAAEARVLTVATHDSFAVSEEIVAQFESAHNARVQFLQLGDAGEALNKIILTKDAPLADLFFGVDNTFLSRAQKSGAFVPHRSAATDALPAELLLDGDGRLLPVDFGYVTLNADQGWYAERGLILPTALEQLAEPAYRDQLVVQNPATSSPGLSFLLATIDHFGEEGWQPFWASLRANGVRVTDGWTEAYYEFFTVGSGGVGDRPLVVSYSSSPPADVIFATDGRTEPASVNVNLEGGVFRQIEFVGILQGASQPDLAAAWVDFMLSTQFQNDIPLQMFVYPVNPAATLPELFTQFGAPPAQSSSLDPALIEANRERWLNEWTEIMLR